MTKILFWIITILTTMACVPTEHKPPHAPDSLAASKGYQLGEAVKTLQNYELSGWRYINQRAIIMSASPSRDYLITLKERCYELSTSEVIGTTATGNIIHAAYDALVVSIDGSSIGSGRINTRKCHIEGIYALSKLPTK